MTPDPKCWRRLSFDLCSTALPIAYERTCIVEGYMTSSGESCGVIFPSFNHPFFRHNGVVKTPIQILLSRTSYHAPLDCAIRHLSA